MEDNKYTKNCKGYLRLRNFCTPIFYLLFNPTVEGLENIPDEPVIFVGAHRHKFDQYPVVCSLKKTIHWMAKEEYFEGPTAFFYNSTGCIRVDRFDKAKSKNCMIEAEKYLEAGSSIGIFAEGTRNTYIVAVEKKEKLEEKLKNNPNDEKLIKEYEEAKLEIEKAYNTLTERGFKVIEGENLLELKFGPVSMARKANVKIIPFVVTGSFKPFKYDVILSYGKPITVTTEGDLTSSNEELKSSLNELLSKQKVLRKR